MSNNRGNRGAGGRGGYQGFQQGGNRGQPPRQGNQGFQQNRQPYRSDEPPEIDNGAATNVAEFTKASLVQMEKAPVGKSLFVTRPSYGKVYDKLITLSTNSFVLKVSDKLKTVYHYDVSIEQHVQAMAGDRAGPPRRQRKIPKERNVDVLKYLVANNSQVGDVFYSKERCTKIVPVFDRQKNMYTMCPLGVIGLNPGQEIELKVTVPDISITSAKGRIHSKEESGDYLVTIAVPGGNDVGRCAIDMTVASRYYNDGRVDQIPNDVIQALNVILKQGLSAEAYISVGMNSLYPKNGERISLGGGVDMMKGHFQSVRPASMGLTLVVDQTNAAFYPNMSVMEYARELLRTNDVGKELMDARTRIKFVSALKTVKFQTFYMGHKRVRKNLTSISDRPASEIRFSMDVKIAGQVVSQKTVSVYDYFKEAYTGDLATVRDPYLPCLDFQTRGQDGKVKNNFIPIELCYLLDNQNVPGRLHPDQTANMIKYAAAKPISRSNHILETVKKIKVANTEVFAEFNLDLNLNQIRVAGKTLSTPTLVYGQNQKVKPDNERGSWRTDRVKLYQGARITNWVLVSVDARFDSKTFASGLVNKATSMNVQMSPATSCESMQYNDIATIREMFVKIKKAQPNTQLIVWVAGGPRLRNIYSDIKAVGELRQENMNINSQFVNIKTTEKRDPDQVMSNIMLKINAKCGGVNQIILEADKPAALQKAGVMILGADVTHQTPADLTENSISGSGIRVESSIASLVGTVDSNYFKYHATTRVQNRERLEMITQMDEMLVEVLKAYFSNNNRQLPKHIIYYRDGVSEGQFQSVLDQEIEIGMMEAFKEVTKLARLPTPYKPDSITLIIVQKRHHHRIRPQFAKDGKGKTGNVPAGTYVDSGITHPRDFDYFLNSHEGIQGTSKPTHYCVIRDDLNLGPDELYKMTFFLCHTYANCTRSISIPTPVAYAHKAAFRAREYVQAKPLPTIKLPPRPTEDQIVEAKTQRITALNELIQVSDTLKKVYFY